MKRVAWMVVMAGVGIGLLYAQGRALDLKREKRSTEAALFEAEEALRLLRRSAAVPASAAPSDEAPPVTSDATVSELREALNAKDEEIRSLRGLLAKANEAQAKAAEPAAPRRPSWQDRMEQLKEENPEEYERVQQERAAWREEAANRSLDRVMFFESVATDGLSEDYLENHHALVERLRFFNEVFAEMAEDPEGEAARELRGKMRENFRGLREMMEMEREVLLNDLVTDLGFPDDIGREVVDYVNFVNEMTSLQMPWGRGRGGGSGGRPPSAEGTR